MSLINGYRLMRVDIGRGEDPTPARPELLFERPYRKALWESVYDIAADGRLIMIEGGEDDRSLPEIRILTNWFASLER